MVWCFHVGKPWEAFRCVCLRGEIDFFVLCCSSDVEESRCCRLDCASKISVGRHLMGKDCARSLSPGGGLSGALSPSPFLSGSTWSCGVSVGRFFPSCDHGACSHYPSGPVLAMAGCYQLALWWPRFSSLLSEVTFPGFLSPLPGRGQWAQHPPQGGTHP